MSQFQACVCIHRIYSDLRVDRIALGQGAKQKLPDTSVPDADADHVQQRSEWFFRGRLVPRKPSAELRRRAYQAKLQMRAQRAAALALRPDRAAATSSGGSIPLGPEPLASDATGNGTQDYHQAAGRATAVAVDPADSTGNTVFIGGAQSGVWKSTNAANNTANSVLWTPVTDDQATLSIGALAILPGNTDPAQTVILAATGEADNSADSYFGLGILRSTDAGASWNSISETGITNCGDSFGCGVEQGFYNVVLLAVPKVAATDLYAGAINLYKCKINSQNPSCAASQFLNLTRPRPCASRQHALAYTIPTSGTDSGNALI